MPGGFLVRSALLRFVFGRTVEDYAWQNPSDRTEPAGRQMRIGATLVLLLLLSGGPANAAIDCSRASSNADLLVCSNDRLAVADERMALAFRDAMRRGVDRNKLITTQRDWKANVRDRCNDVACLMRAYEDRAAELDNF